MTRAALVTGGSSGIGLAIARALGEDGHRLTISSRRPEKLEAAAQQLRDDGLEVDAVPANMTDEEEIRKLVEGHRERCGRLDVLVNNAGLGIGGAVAEAETKKLDLQLNVNLRAVYLLARECIPLLKELSRDGVQVTALCPGFVATPMTDWIEGQVPKEEMIQPDDIAESIRFLLRTSPHCMVPELQFVRPGDSEL